MVKLLMKSIRQYKKDTVLTPLYVSVEVVFDVLIPFLMAYLIDLGIDMGNMGNILKYGIILIAAAFTALYFGMLSGKHAARASGGFAQNLRQDMFYKIQGFSFASIDKFSTASIITRLTTDVVNVQNAFQMLIRIAIRSPLMLIFSLAMSFTISPSLSLIFLFVVPVLAAGLYLIIKNAHPIFVRVFKTYDKLNNIVQENIRGIRVVKSFVREDYEKQKFGGVSEKMYKDFSKAEKIIAFNSPLMQVCVYICILVMSWFGAKLIVSGNLTTGQLFSLITYITQILMALMMFSMVLVMVTISRASAERITEILREEIDLKNSENPVMQMKGYAIDFNNVTFSYTKDNSKLCLKGIGLKIKEGEKVGIIGGTGSAKTSLVQLIPRLYDVTGGSLTIGGIDVKDYDIKTLRDEIAMVLQKNLLFSGTVKENLLWGNKDASDEEIKRACRLAQADGFLERLEKGYDTYVEQGGANFSGGQRQRLCIARALLKNPKILILDDSTSAVDTRTDSLIRKAFYEEIPDTTVIIIAQRISSVQDADKIIIMDNGFAAAAGTHEELLAGSPIYREIYNSQIKGSEENENAGR